MADASALENSSVEALMSLRSAGRNRPSPIKDPVPTPPRRGNPPRIRKRNRLIFNDDEDTSMSPIRSSPKRNRTTPTNSPAKSQHSRDPHPKSHSVPSTPHKSSAAAIQNLILSTPAKKSAQKTGARLKNLLKLPKAYKWCIYEWFYSNIDKALFSGENDFLICLRESFPQLKCRKLTRVEWCIIRRLMGKPRRCSPAFFAEERAALDAKRRRLRLLQQRKSNELDTSDMKDLPQEIPLPLVIGTKVTARLRNPHDGLFTGQIDAIDTQNATYRVTFDRHGLGTHTIPDTEVLGTEPQETMPLSAFLNKQRPRPSLFSPPRITLDGLHSPGLDHDPMLGMSPLRGKLQGDEKKLGGFPVKFLVLVTRLSKILGIKKDLLQELKDMNTDAERMQSLNQSSALDFKENYAKCVLQLEKLNDALNTHLNDVQQYCQEIAPEQGLPPLSEPTADRLQCDQEASQMVHDANLALGDQAVKNPKLNDLIASLTSLMLQIKSLAKNDMNSYGFKSLNESLDEMKKKIDPSNLRCFQDNVEVHIAHIQSGMSQMGNLHAFAEKNVDY
ncbi:protein lin-9 homolog isoform X1 [Patiria miniata]|uniref:DIRP domain-containing protein n=2 Tax=Patiria miniata TaxID=46514 RepID=A0A913Z6R1_PATMI|nr:protein lin-9 homolog isoform X1 [Patiria miniata]